MTTQEIGSETFLMWWRVLAQSKLLAAATSPERLGSAPIHETSCWTSSSFFQHSLYPQKKFSVKQVAAVCIEPGGQFIDLTEPPVSARNLPNHTHSRAGRAGYLKNFQARASSLHAVVWLSSHSESETAQKLKCFHKPSASTVHNWKESSVSQPPRTVWSQVKVSNDQFKNNSRSNSSENITVTNCPNWNCRTFTDCKTPTVETK